MLAVYVYRDIPNGETKILLINHYEWVPIINMSSSLAIKDDIFIIGTIHNGFVDRLQ
jgi:hypothetical protein